MKTNKIKNKVGYLLSGEEAKIRSNLYAKEIFGEKIKNAENGILKNAWENSLKETKEIIDNMTYPVAIESKPTEYLQFILVKDAGKNSQKSCQHDLEINQNLYLNDVAAAASNSVLCLKIQLGSVEVNDPNNFAAQEPTGQC